MTYTARLTALAAVAGIVCAGLAGCAAPDAGPRAAASYPDSVMGSPSATPTPDPAGMRAIQVASSPRRVEAAGGVLADVGAKQVLWSRQLNTERPMGSITKVMTALLVIEAGDLNREIRIPKSVLAYVAKYQGESAGLHPGDVLTARQLLYALLLQSGCDAAYVLAMTYGPGMPAFLAKMNAEAAQLGMTHTHFTSPDGLPYPTEHSTYSTPADLLTLGLAAMKLPVFRSIVSQTFYHVAKWKGHHHSYWWDNTDSLIGTYRGAVGIKDGYTNAAKHCLLFEAVRHGKTLMGVVLGSPTTSPFSGVQAATRLLNWGFALNPSA
jgi:serine-type D-Ala-D-Ala carboxypeptidase (penicillin-binding protein 5/6)